MYIPAVIKTGPYSHFFVMFKKPLYLLLVGFFVGVSLLPAQEKPQADTFADDEAQGKTSFWQASLTGGHYMVALGKIVSISRHKYLLDAALIVDEVTVDTEGDALARFYFITPVSDKAPGNTIPVVANRGKESVDGLTHKLAAGTENMVMKKYPETTHAKTIEYRMLDEKSLTALYASVEKALVSGKGRHFRME